MCLIREKRSSHIVVRPDIIIKKQNYFKILINRGKVKGPYIFFLCLKPDILLIQQLKVPELSHKTVLFIKCPARTLPSR